MIQYDQKSYRELRCLDCRRLLGIEYIYSGRLSLRCPRCKRLNYFEFRPLKPKDKTTIGKEVSTNGSRCNECEIGDLSGYV